MKKTVVIAAALAGGAIGFGSAPLAFADDHGVTTQQIGQQGQLVNGGVVQAWTVTDLRPSSDVIPYQPQGTLWEATASDQAIQGSVTPIVSNLNARAATGETYQALFGVATPQGVNPATLAQGASTTGKVYFDVVGATPDSVVYNAGGDDLLIWVQPPPSQSNGGWTSYPAGSGSSATPAGTAGTAPAATTPGAAEAPAGSQGTPLPQGSSGTPLPAGAAPATAGPPAAAGTAPAPAGTTPAPAGTAPAPAGTAPAPAGTAPAPAGTPAPAQGSQGTQLPATSSQGTSQSDATPDVDGADPNTAGGVPIP